MFADAYNNRGLAKIEMKDNEGAISDFNEAIEISPDFAMAYSNRGVVKIRMGSKEEGCADLKNAISLGNLLATDLILQFCQ